MSNPYSISEGAALFELVIEAVKAVRKIRADYQIPPHLIIPVYIIPRGAACGAALPSEEDRQT